MRDEGTTAAGQAEAVGAGQGARSHLAEAAAKEAARDPRLDFFRGLGMYIILIAHIPWNSWNGWIPARFGYSDATEIFVFCSGAASAIAFYKVFDARGWMMGAARVAFRIWQIYWCHIGVFFAIAGSMVALDTALDNDRYYESVLNLRPFFDRTGPQLLGLMKLSYVPNYFDILVMYIGVLALMPVIVALSWIRPWVAMAFSLAVWAAASQPWLALIDVPVFTGLNPPAEPWSARTWFFNPFAWQLIFFTGFAYSLGWLPRPAIRARWMALAAVALLIMLPLDPDGAFRRLVWQWSKEGSETAAAILAFFDPAWSQLGPLVDKTFFGLFRYLHFLTLAYLVWALAGERGSRLPDTGLAGRFVTVVRRVGQQSLAVFVASLVLARLLGALINEAGRTEAATAFANLFGFLLITGVAYTARWFRRQPWRDKAPR